jgi:hypothetical protein
MLYVLVHDTCHLHMGQDCCACHALLDPLTTRSPRCFLPPCRLLYCRPDDDDDTPDRSHKQVPDWARGPALRAALVAQHCMDPELVFGVLKNASCDLVEMFKGVGG